MKILKVGFLLCLICGVASAAPAVRTLGGANTISSGGTTGPRRLAVTPGAARAATGSVRNAAVTRGAAAARSSSVPRLSVGSLYNNAGRPQQSSAGTNSAANVDLSGYAKLGDLDSLGNQLNITTTELNERIDSLSDLVQELELAEGTQGPEGPAGEQGPQGETGPRGEKGDKGYSAYELAVLNGFSGTEAQWLESLKGKDGEMVNFPTAGTDGLYIVRINNGITELEKVEIETGIYTGD